MCNSVVHDLDVLNWIFGDADVVLTNSVGKKKDSFLDLTFDVKRADGVVAKARILYRKMYRNYTQRISITVGSDTKVFGYEFEAPEGTSFPNEWAVSGPCMASKWKGAYVSQFEAFADMIESNIGDEAPARRIGLLESYGKTFALMDSVSSKFK